MWKNFKRYTSQHRLNPLSGKNPFLPNSMPSEMLAGVVCIESPWKTNVISATSLLKGQRTLSGAVADAVKMSIENVLRSGVVERRGTKSLVDTGKRSSSFYLSILC